MPTTVQFRRGTTAQNNAFTGAVGEVTVDTDKNTLVVHDGSTAGGVALTSSAATDPAFTSSTTLKPELTLKNTTDDATGPIITLESDRATPADNDIAGTIQFIASDDAGAQTTIGTIQATISDVTNSTEDGKLTFKTFVNGSDTTIATMDASGLTLSTGQFVGTATAAQYSDLAEMYSADSEYEPGTVVSFGGEKEITQSTQSHDSRVAGVVSTAPAYLMNSGLENGTALALHGRVPCKVIGRITKGDLIVASSTPGVAQSIDSSFYAPGCVIGKALENYDSQSIGTIEVVVGRL
jgi:hypothetical protein